MKKDKVSIKVVLTRECKFRAEIKEPGQPKYAVTVGGKEWQKGTGREHAEEIRKKCILIRLGITDTLQDLMLKKMWSRINTSRKKVQQLIPPEFGPASDYIKKDAEYLQNAVQVWYGKILKKYKSNTDTK
jgi:hypothetical protein